MPQTNQHSLIHKEKHTERKAATAAQPLLTTVKKQLVCLSGTLFYSAGKKCLYYWYVKLQQLLCQHLSLEYLREKQEREPEGKDNLQSHLIFIHLSGKRALTGVILVFWTPFYLCLQAAFFFFFPKTQSTVWHFLFNSAPAFSTYFCKKNKVLRRSKALQQQRCTEQSPSSSPSRQRAISTWEIWVACFPKVCPVAMSLVQLLS